jgi:inhibitor of KinA
MKDAPSPGIRFQAASDQSLLLYFGDKISLETHRKILKLIRLISAEPIKGCKNIHPAYCSVLLKFDSLNLTHEQLGSVLRSYCARLEDVELPEPRKRRIPVCYGGELGPDLEEVAKLHSTSSEEVVRLHSVARYNVYFLGFVPGFAYLGGLPEELATPRLPTPRKKVPAGSVAIGGNQTGVYPRETPGGWRLIGRTAVRLFDTNAPEKSFLQIGDEVQFVPIGKEEFLGTSQ